MSDQREAIRSNAKYLRNVRPIDPDEICAYVAGNPHPAVVRQQLREDAVDLGLLERDDGTFVPVDDDPVSPRPGPVERLPAAYESRLEDLLVDRYGVDWHADATGELLRSTIRRFKERYLDQRHVDYDEDVAAGYAIYHLPTYYAAVQYALDDLAEQDLLGKTVRVLDIGAGVGGPALGLCEYLPDDALVDYHAIEPSAAADILEGLFAETRRNVHTTVHRTTAEAFDPAAVSDGDGGADGFEPTAPDDGFDLVLACNVLSELDDPEAITERYLDLLAPDGTLLAMAPADKNTAIGLREVERTLEGRAIGDGASDDTPDDAGRRVTVYGPTVRLWAGKTPTDRGWSFDVRPDLAVPSFQRRLDEAAPEHDEAHAPGEFINVDVQFAYSQLRLDGRQRIDLDLDHEEWAMMAEMERHVTNRIDLAAAKLSHSLSEGNPLYKISDGSESIDHYAVLTNETAFNRALDEAEYGNLLAFENVLALWNDDEEAYNLVVDEETIVDRIG